MISGDRTAELYQRWLTSDHICTFELKQLLKVLRFLWDFNRVMKLLPEARLYTTDVERVERILQARKEDKA